LVRVLDATTGLERFHFLAYNGAYTGGVQVATGDVNGDGVPDIITASTAPGGAPRVRVFDGHYQSGGAGLVAGFVLYAACVRRTSSVAAGDVNGDGQAEIITAPGAGLLPRVKVFSGINPDRSHPLASFLAYGPNFLGGVHVAAGDINGDGHADIVTGPGAGLPPRVKVFNGGNPDPYHPLDSFFAYGPNFLGGVNVAVGDTNGDGHADI